MRGGAISKSYDKGLVSRFKIDTFAQADINSFCIMVDSGDGQVRVARGSGGISGAGGGVASTMNCCGEPNSRPLLGCNSCQRDHASAPRSKAGHR